MSRGWRMLALPAVLVACAVWTQPAVADELAPLGRYDYAPYRVRVLVAFAAHPCAGDRWRRDVIGSLEARIAQSFGAVWDLGPGVEQDHRLLPADRRGLQRLEEAAAANSLPKADCDKAYYLAIWLEGARWHLAGREWDAATERLGPVLDSTAVDRRALADAGAALLRRLFSPLLIIDDADRDSKRAVLTVRGGSIPFADPRVDPLGKGSILLPVFRFLDTQGAVRKIQPLPWTYLVAETLDKSHVTASIESPYRAPLAANMRRRVQAVALLVRPTFGQTRVRLVAGKDQPQPQAGLYVDLVPLVKPAAPPAEAGSEAPSAPEATKAAAATSKADEPAKSPAVRLMSDRQGFVVIPADPQDPIRRIEVHSGSAVLARRPFVPGLETETTLELPQDRPRLFTEREIDLLRDRLVETVARRAAIMARTRALVKNNDVEAVRQSLLELSRPPGPNEFQTELNKIRVLGLEDARRRKDRLSERRIEDLCRRTAELIDQYLPADRVRLFEEEIHDLIDPKRRDKPGEGTAATAAPAAPATAAPAGTAAPADTVIRRRPRKNRD
jgi:hypothetical protein